MTVQELLGSMVENIAISFAEFIAVTTEELLQRGIETSMARTRSGFALAEECVSTNRYVDALLRLEANQTLNRSDIQSTLSSITEAKEQLIESGVQLRRTIEQLRDADLAKQCPHWRGSVRALDLIIGTYRNTAYHSGQINLMQILDGDAEFHLPTNWYSVVRSDEESALENDNSLPQYSDPVV
jgi:hypothetical protein